MDLETKVTQRGPGMELPGDLATLPPEADDSL